MSSGGGLYIFFLCLLEVVAPHDEDQALDRVQHLAELWYREQRERILLPRDFCCGLRDDIEAIVVDDGVTQLARVASDIDAEDPSKHTDTRWTKLDEIVFLEFHVLHPVLPE